MSKQHYYQPAHDSEEMRKKLRTTRRITREIEAKIVAFKNCNIKTNENPDSIEQFNEVLRLIESRLSMLDYFNTKLEFELSQIIKIKAILYSLNV